MEIIIVIGAFVAVAMPLATYLGIRSLRREVVAAKTDEGVYCSHCGMVH